MGFHAVPVKGSLENDLGSLGILLPGDFKAQGLEATRESTTLAYPDPGQRDAGPAPRAKG